MDSTSPAAHATHDESLIARLYGGDLAGAERTRALDLVSECPECESLLADFGAIAEATAALPVPPRLRDFSLTEADASRLRRKTPVRSRILRLGLRRSIGGSLAALGIFGVMLTATTAILGGAANTTSGYAFSPERPGATPVPGAVVLATAADSVSNSGPAGVATAGPAATVANDATSQAPAMSAAGVLSGTASSRTLEASASASAGLHDLAAASAAVPQGESGSLSGATKSGQSTGPSSTGIDVRLVGLIGFASLFIVGLALAILPVRRRGRDRSARS